MAASSGPVWGRDPQPGGSGPTAGGPPSAPLPPVVPYHPPQPGPRKRRFGLRGPGELTPPVIARLCLLAVLGVLAMFLGEEDDVLVTCAGGLMLLSAVVYFFFRL